MRILTLIVIIALPLLVLGQTAEQPQQTQGQTNETQTIAPAKGKKMQAAQEQTEPQARPETGKAETGTDVRAKTNVKGRAQDMNKTEAGTHASTTTRTKVNVQEFKSRHSEVFSLGRHPKEFFVQRFGERHFRLISNTYFVFVDSCWVAVDVDGYTYSERVICPGDPEFIVID